MSQRFSFQVKQLLADIQLLYDFSDIKGNILKISKVQKYSSKQSAEKAN